MADKGKGRRKTVDKWKKKQWFTILASKIFDKKPLGETPSEKATHLTGRTLNYNLANITGQRNRRDTTVYFKYKDVQGTNINTTVSKFDVSKGTLMRMVRRNNSKVTLVKKIPVDCGEARITTNVVTSRKATGAQKTGIRKIIDEEVNKFKGKDFENIVKELLMGKFASDLNKKASKICMTKKTVVSKASFTEAK
jgi:small subunit ribosomal protein S3Ae